MNNETYFWNPNDTPYSENFDSDFNNFQTQPLGFQSRENFDQYPNASSGNLFEPVEFTGTENDFDEEPPLLEELEIYPDRIAQKVLAVLNPFRSHGLTDDAEYLNKDPDLAGPIFFYLVLGVCLLLSGSKAYFSYIYGISVVSSLMMYCLLNLMSSQNLFHITSVASVLGYSLIPIVGLSAFGIFITLKGVFGVVLAACAVLWSSVSASRLFVAISGDKEQQPLVAYPCALVSAVYVLLVLF